MTEIRYLLDEKLTHSIRVQLLFHHPLLKVQVVGDGIAPPKGTPDPDLLKWIQQHEYILVSRDRNTMPGHVQDHLDDGGGVPGIFLVRRRVSLGRLIEDLLLIHEVAHPDDFRDNLTYLPL